MIKLAIPNKGRVNANIVKLLEKMGLDVPENGRKLYANTSNPNIQLVYARAADIPFYVESGVADLGITGEDMIRESGMTVEKLFKLNFGSCQIVVAAPKNSRVKSPSDYSDGIRVVTKLVNTARTYFAKRNIRANIIRLSGALELAPNIGIADVIIDQVSTGTTLAANNLQVVDTIAKSDICLVANKRSMKEKEEEIDELKLAVESVITAEQKRYVIANVKSEEELKRVVKVMPCMESPTVLKLAKEGEYAVQSVVDSKDLITAIRKLKQAGARDILVMNMSRVVE
ncbi:MAG: ATP phosphoribosyltransferase [Candidatus Micrarchaeota archaeon]|nr:ATP phosphoribosyltransferase [Candidatus Micrarchaeota archaeon]